MKNVFRTAALLTVIAVTIALPTTVGTAVAADRDYGEYLSSECVTCHRPDATDAKIPSIAGMDGEGFIAVMNAYRAKELDNATMQTIAKRLSDKDIAALAAYFSSLPAAE